MGDCDDADSLTAPLFVVLLDTGPDLFIHCAFGASDFNPRADGEDAVQGPFHDHYALSILLNNDTQSFPVEIKRDFPLFFDGTDIHIFGCTDCLIQRICHTCLKTCIQVRKPEHFIGGLPRNIGRAIEPDAPLRQGSGFIGTKDIHAAKIFDCGQAADDNPFLRHDAGSFRKRNADDCRQKLRRNPNCKCNREK